jgi:prephenate dehydratase
VFWGAGAERPGWLVRCLDEFARREINLTKIESRPRRERLGHYMFFADLHGHAEDPEVAQALAGLRAVCEEARVLGSYPAAAPVPEPPPLAAV